MRLSSDTTVLVTGACGFIGSHLTEALVRLGCRVRALVGYTNSNAWGNLEHLDPNILDSVEVILGNVQDPFLIQKAVKGCGAVFHLAALISIPYSYETPSGYVDTNVKGTLNILHSSLNAGVERVIHTSTSEVYGTAVYTPIDEKHVLQAQSPYSATKIAADKLAESYFCSFKLPVSIVRPFNTYGPRQSARAIIPSVIGQILSGSKALKVGSTTPVRDFNYVSDTVNGFISVAQSDRAIGEAVNIGSGRGVTIGETIDLIMKVTNSKIEIVSDESRIRPQKSEVFNLICDNRKAKALAGWESKVSLENGLKQTVQYMEQHLGLYKTGLYCR